MKDKSEVIYTDLVIPEVSKMITDYGHLSVTTSTTQLQEITESSVYLASYSYQCNEQIASRLLGLIPVMDILKAFNDKKRFPE